MKFNSCRPGRRMARVRFPRRSHRSLGWSEDRTDRALHSAAMSFGFVLNERIQRDPRLRWRVRAAAYARRSFLLRCIANRRPSLCRNGICKRGIAASV